jgi:PAS domain S-box-containing protein
LESGYFLTGLQVMAGVCLYACVHHGVLALKRPTDWRFALFAALCLATGLYVVAKSYTFQAETPGELVALHRLDLSFAMVTLMLLPWFLRAYAGLRSRITPTLLSGLFALLLLADLLLPYGIRFVHPPAVSYRVLPWGERILDIGNTAMSPWFALAWWGLALVFVYAAYTVVHQYRRGTKRDAVEIGVAMALFGGAVALEAMVEFADVNLVSASELGLLPLVVLMSRALARDRRESRKRMKAVMDNVPGLVSLKDRHGRYLFVNRWFENHYSMSLADVLGKTDRELFPEEADTIQRSDQRVVQTGEAVETEDVFDGGDRVWSSLRFPIVDTDGTIWALGQVTTDITARLAAESEARDLRRQLWHAERVTRTNTISTSIAHELMQPLAAILSNAQAGVRLLDRDPPDLGEIREILEDIARDDKRAGAVISGLRGMLHRRESERERTDVGQCVADVLKMMRSEFVTRGIECQRDIETGCYAVVNVAQIQQVVLNLLVNSMEAMEQAMDVHGRIRISVACRDRKTVQISVRDSGSGVRDSDLASLFKPFYTTKSEGMGIGLAICRSIVEEHGGRIWAERNDSEPGVTFFVALPCSRESTEDECDDSQSGRSARTYSIRGGR